MTRDLPDSQAEGRTAPRNYPPGKRRDDALQTIAVYWEPKIKTYGFQEVGDLALVQMDLPAPELPRWGEEIQELEGRIAGFHLVTIQPHGEGDLCGYLLCESEAKDEIRDFFRRSGTCAGQSGPQVISPVELLFFFGPHFGDRYGIGDAAFGTLSKKGIPILAASCSGSALFLVVPAGKAMACKEALGEAFEVP